MNLQKWQLPVSILILVNIIVVSCDPIFRERKYEQGAFPDNPQNLIEINSEFDDYNSAAPWYGEVFPLCFSSNRNSQGSHFDIIYKLMSIGFSVYDGELDIYNETSSNLDVVMRNSNLISAMSAINTGSDEFGPYLIPMGRISTERVDVGRYESYLIIYSSGKDGSQDIFYTENRSNFSYSDPEPIDFLNSEFDDMYPVFNRNFSAIYFSSNRNSNFDIFSIQTDSIKEIQDILQSEAEGPIVMDTMLSSDYNDKCPFIIGDYMVFCSDREGGYGGYDLYSSKFIDGMWTEAVNMGEKINTEYDEYRPILRAYNDIFTNDFLLFSSNRPGGMGAFDLYYVGIPKLQNIPVQ